MTTIPPPPNFVDESDRYFLSTYNRAIDQNFHIVPMDRWGLVGIRTSRDKIFEGWQKQGLGRVIVEDDGLGTHTHFSLSDAGIAYGKKLDARQKRRSWKTRVAKSFWPALSGIAALVAAVAAVFAAYFSYLGLQGH